MLDTNILISIVIFNSQKLKTMLINICEKHKLILNSYIIQELQEVIERKFPNRKKDMEEFLFKIPYELEYVPNTIFEKDLFNLRDIKDIPILYSAIISNVDIESLGVAIATENVTALKSVPGIGPKMAQKIIFELKDKVIKDKTEKINIVLKENNSKNIEEAITALEVLGYTQKQIKDVISKLDLSDDSVENIIRKVLKEMQNL